MGRRVAVVEDEAELAALVEYNLVRSGFECRIFPGSKGTIAAILAWQPDLVVLDVMLPDADGFELCRGIRRAPSLEHVPILFLTARSDEVDRVLGLEIGGDDYITKPFSPRELMARVKAHLRRSERQPTGDSVSAGPLRIDRAAHRVFLADRELALTSMEFRLLEFFVSHPGLTYSREQLLTEVWGTEHFITPRSVDVHIRRLREHIEEQPAEPKQLVTVRGFGYRFEATE